MPSNTNKTNYTIKYAGIQAFFWINFALLLGYTSLYLLDAGFDNTQIGIIIALAGVISAVLQPILASYADRPNSLSLKQILIFLITITLGIAILLLISYRRFMILTGLLYGIGITILQLLTPLINSLGMESINQGKNINFGFSRGLGSAAYAVAAYILGIIVNKTTPLSIPISMLLSFGALLIAVILFPFQKVKKSNTTDIATKSSGNPIYFFTHYKRFSVVLFGCIFIYLSHILLNTFTFQIAQSKGGGSSEMGFSMALAAMLELPTMFLFAHVVKKIRCDILFRITGIFFFLKAFGTFLAPNIPFFYAVQVFQMFGWALLTVASVYYVNALMEEQDAIKGQAYLTMTYTLGTVFGSLIGGTLLDHVGVSAMLIVASIAAAIGAIILLLVPERIK